MYITVTWKVCLHTILYLVYLVVQSKTCVIDFDKRNIFNMKCYKTLSVKVFAKKAPPLVTLGHCMKRVHDGKYLDLEAGKGTASN